MEAAHAFRFDHQVHEVPFFIIFRGEPVAVFIKERRPRYGCKDGNSRISDPVCMNKPPHIAEILFFKTAVDDKKPHQIDAVFMKNPDGLYIEGLRGMLLVGIQKAVGNRLQTDHDVAEAGFCQLPDQGFVGGNEIGSSVADKGFFDIPFPEQPDKGFEPWNIE